VNHTRFPKEGHLPYWASGQQSYEGWSCILSTTKMGARRVINPSSFKD